MPDLYILILKGVGIMKKVFVGIVLAMTLIAAPAMAKEGLFVGVNLVPSVDISGDAGSDIDGGSGYGFKIGFGLNKYFSIEGILEKTELDVKGGGETLDMDGMGVDLRVNFPLTTLDSAQVMSFEPYVLLGFGRYEVSPPVGDSATGTGLRYGIGIEQYLFRELSINLGYTSTSVTFDTTPEQDGTIRTIDFGVIYHFL
jgi:opacity protein-like surface antigen